MDCERPRSAAPLTCTLPGPLSTASAHCVLDILGESLCESAGRDTLPCNKLECKSGASSSGADPRVQPYRHQRPWLDITARRHSSIPTTTLAACPRLQQAPTRTPLPRPPARPRRSHSHRSSHRNPTSVAEGCLTSHITSSWRPPSTSSAVSADCSTPRPPMRRLSTSQACAASC